MNTKMTYQIGFASMDIEVMVMMLGYFGCLVVVAVVLDAFAVIVDASCLAAYPPADHRFAYTYPCVEHFDVPDRRRKTIFAVN